MAKVNIQTFSPTRANATVLIANEEITFEGGIASVEKELADKLIAEPSYEINLALSKEETDIKKKEVTNAAADKAKANAKAKLKQNLESKSLEELIEICVKAEMKEEDLENKTKEELVDFILAL